MTRITDSDDLPREEDAAITPQARRRTLFLKGIIKETLERYEGEILITATRCLRRPGRRPCGGTIRAEIAENGTAVHWFCPQCGDNGQVILRQEERPDGYETTLPERHVYLKGRIGWDGDLDIPFPEIIAAGVTTDWLQLGQELSTYEGFDIIIEVVDPTDKER